MPDDNELLARVPLFASLPANELTQLAATLRVVAMPSNTVLFKEGEYGDHFYVIRSGQIEIVKELGTPDERLIALRGPGEFVGEMSLFNRDRLRTASVRSRRDSQVWEMTREEFDALLKRQPFLAYEMVRVLSERLTSAHNLALADLHEKNRQLQVAYDELKAAQAQIIEKEKLERELQVAAEIQMSILPRGLPTLAGFDFGARLVPARSVGGDWFDFIPQDTSRLGIVVGDVTDKGVPAAIFMAQTHALLRAEASRGDSPGETLHRVNGSLLEMNAAGLFVTVLYGILDRSDAAFTYARAGHDLPLIASVDGEVRSPVQGRSTALGLMPILMLDEQTLKIPPRGMLLLYTDGIVEGCNPGDEQFGKEGVSEVLRANRNSSAQVVCDELIRALRAFQSSAPQHDDVTLVAVRA